MPVLVAATAQEAMEPTWDKRRMQRRSEGDMFVVQKPKINEEEA